MVAKLLEHLNVKYGITQLTKTSRDTHCPVPPINFGQLSLAQSESVAPI